MRWLELEPACPLPRQRGPSARVASRSSSENDWPSLSRPQTAIAVASHGRQGQAAGSARIRWVTRAWSGNGQYAVSGTRRQ
jgi:hypothetical protein